jgi:hypothetical protein
MKWWEAPEYDKRQPMNFPAPDPSAPMERLPGYVVKGEKDHPGPVRVYARKACRPR